MAKKTPFMTSDDLIRFIELSMFFPRDQSTLTYNDILELAYQEMLIGAVPSIMVTHEEYFSFKRREPLLANIGKYDIPNRALGMVLRDLKYSDANGNFNDMTRIAPEDKAFFQNNTGVNQVISKYYIEGNEIVLTPQTSLNPTGYLNHWIFLRPNSLVRNDRACIIQNFVKYITLSNYAALVPGVSSIEIETNVQSISPTVYTFTAVSGTPGPFQFQIGGDNVSTAANLNAAIVAAGLLSTVITVGTTATNVLAFTYNNISTTFYPLNGVIDIDINNIFINFNQLPNSYTDIDVGVPETLYSDGCLVDFLQTLPGHRTYNYDVTLIAINPYNSTTNATSVGQFAVSQLQDFNNNSSGGTMTFYNIIIGDYICLQNECIIPQIPPELHSALAERTVSRILMGMGDRDGYVASQNKLAQMDAAKDTLIGSRVESSVPKVFNRYNLLRMGKRVVRRRFV